MQEKETEGRRALESVPGPSADSRIQDLGQLPFLLALAIYSGVGLSFGKATCVSPSLFFLLLLQSYQAYWMCNRAPYPSGKAATLLLKPETSVGGSSR